MVRIKKIATKTLFFLLLVFSSTIIVSCGFGQVLGQKCKNINISKNDLTGTKSMNIAILSKEFNSLYIEKKYNRDKENRYFLLVIVGSEMLSDSLLKTEGTFEFLLDNGKNVVLQNAKCTNKPFGSLNDVGYYVNTTESTIKLFAKNSIVRIKVFSREKIEFTKRKQKKQKEMFGCFISHKEN